MVEVNHRLCILIHNLYILISAVRVFLKNSISYLKMQKKSLYGTYSILYKYIYHTTNSSS